VDYNDKKIMIGLSGGINSMAVLCWLVESGMKPKELHLYYAHFEEHSPDTFQFVADGIRYARKHFPIVIVKITKNSILRYFEKVKMILHPARGLCSFQLKIEPINRYAAEFEIDVDLIGYVKHELKRRAGNQQKNLSQPNMFHNLEKHYPIGDFSDEWCFEIVKKHIGWYPKIYDIRDESGKRVFKHNNCLPCKNMYPKDLSAIRTHFPKFFDNAMKTSEKLKKHWGRDSAEFYTEFGRELGQESTCNTCKF
jgi:3'-phosphoadenosine 5'-phosphosulfate sulfotransferase (PAPS reductase)/FAD synthetase